ncbi:MFS transporter [Streptosporangium sp. CA-135522]|uniref:MFS transporter n=1 Tax=Streptosporangium sp. CA-135522 TaxID=3240072 RepID=UPI003D924FD3
MSTSAQRAGDGEPRFRDSLRQLPSTVWIISLGILVNRIGNFLPVFMVLYLTSQNFSPAAAGLVLGAAGLGNVLGNALGGYLADRLGRRWTIVLSMVATAGLTAGIPLFDTLPVLIALAGLAGTAAQVYRPAASALLVDATTTTQQRLAAFAVHRFAMNIGAAIGGVLGGVLATVSYVGLFLGNAVACLLLAAIAAGLLRDVVHAGSDAGQGHGPGSAEPEPSYRQALADRRLRRFLVMTLIAEFIYIQSTVGLPLHVSAIGLSPASFGLLMGLNGLLVMLLELPITSAVSRRRPEPVLAVGNLLTGVGLALTVVANDMLWLAATVLLWTLGEMLYASMANAYLGGLVPPAMGGRYQGLYGAAITLGTGVGPLIGGAVYAYREWALWVVCAVGGVVSAQLCLPRRSRSSPVAAPGSERVGSGSRRSRDETEASGPGTGGQ